MELFKNNKLETDHQKEQKPELRPAAIYARMSTEHQKYSIENQSAAIDKYAEENDFEVIKKYIDDGKSGLKFESRDALKQMISDVQSGIAEYQAILVLDISRWGRFQDSDESAYYEYTCRRCGIEVHYVAESFKNDGSISSNIIKSLKRTMAGEYSRELSNKVFAGQCRLIEKGYKQGGTAGYGLRRMLIDEYGNHKNILKYGEHKSIQTDRVILVPGPEEEIETVNWIYHAFIEDRFTETEIADILNQKEIKTDLDREWTRQTVNQVLTNEKYIGNNVFNRRSYKLKIKHEENHPDDWVRCDGAFEGIVDAKLFYTAQGIIREKGRRLTDEKMLAQLKALHNKHQVLSGIIINEEEGVPSSSAYISRFGSLIRAYELIGYTPHRDYSYLEINKKLRVLHKDIISDSIHKIEGLGGTVSRNNKNDLLHINNELKVSLIICRCIVNKDNGSMQWKMHFDTSLFPDITIAIRMGSTNEIPLDYYLLPALDIENPKIRLRDNNGHRMDSYRFDDMESFFMMTERIEIPDYSNSDDINIYGENYG